LEGNPNCYATEGLAALAEFREGFDLSDSEVWERKYKCDDKGVYI
jgi:hypothetical protein